MFKIFGPVIPVVEIHPDKIIRNISNYIETIYWEVGKILDVQQQQQKENWKKWWYIHLMKYSSAIKIILNNNFNDIRKCLWYNLHEENIYL